MKNLAKVARGGIAVLLVAVLALIARYFMTRPQSQVQVPRRAEKIAQQKIERQEKVEHIETKGKEGSLHLWTDRFYLGEDARNHLEGNVKIVFFKRREGKDVFLYGDKVDYDQDWNEFVSSGQAKAEFEDLTIESNLLHYENKKEIFWTDKGVSFYALRLEGSAGTMSYSMKDDRISLTERVRLQMKPKLETSHPINAGGNNLVYSREEKVGTMEGDVQVFHGESRASADSLRFELFPDGENVKALTLKGNVKAMLVVKEEKDASSQAQSSFITRSVRREVEAQEMDIRVFPDIENIQKINILQAQGNCTFKFYSSKGGLTQIQAESVKFVFNPEGEVREFQAIKEARMVEKDEESGEERFIAGETLAIEGEDKPLLVKGKDELEASLVSAESDVFSEEIVIFLDSKDLEVNKGAKVTLKPRKEEEKPIAIFSKEQPVFIKAKEMRYFNREKRFLFRKEIKAWQEKRELLAGEVVLDQETGKILGTEGIKVVFPHKPKEEKEEERIEISSKTMTFEPAQNLVLFEEKCSLKVKDYNLLADSLFLFRKEDTGDIQSLVARRKVKIVRDQTEARGEEATYNPENETVILVGNPVLTDKEMEITRGDKLTFYIADGRILVENQGRERSVTVIKRER